MSNMGNLHSSNYVNVYFEVFTDPYQAFEAINRSIENCMSSHESCQSPAEAYLPSYIVDVDLPGQQGCRLVRTNGQEKGRYAALSYVWGVPLSEQPVYLSRDSEEKLKRGIPEAELPPTLKDTVHVLRKLRIRVEIEKMHNIFGNAFLTIQASRAKSIREGFLHERPSPVLPRQKLRYNDASSQEPAFIYMRAASVTYQEGAAGTRAWCFEEGVLSRRVLQYGPECTTYDCFAGRQSDNGMWDKQGTYTSSGPTFFYPGPWYRGSRVPNDERVNDPRMNILIRWYTALDYHYTPRFLTKERDRLAAIAGVARRIKADICGEFLAGLWSSDMLWGLMWSTRLGLGVKFVNRDIAEEWRLPQAKRWRLSWRVG
ncbi:Het domain-containing protein [Lasiodiplodia theobromae]|uniref:Het domain-containing protein n=1 Tax=Lasiodiplodia theobromae TaxID=45133 RepID=UPI0015C3D203|nr:Het domain-containing protein [Lasiodiplodia theobromae]KAF4537756.1 Het domain-containing protein [Lasiodiplodia theobromae]